MENYTTQMKKLNIATYDTPYDGEKSATILGPPDCIFKNIAYFNILENIMVIGQLNF